MNCPWRSMKTSNDSDHTTVQTGVLVYCEVCKPLFVNTALRLTPLSLLYTPPSPTQPRRWVPSTSTSNTQTVSKPPWYGTTTTWTRQSVSSRQRFNLCHLRGPSWGNAGEPPAQPSRTSRHQTRAHLSLFAEPLRSRHSLPGISYRRKRRLPSCKDDSP